MNHQMVMSLLDRPGDGCAAVRRLVTDNHEPRKRQRQHIRRAIAIYRSLVEADLLEFCDPPDELGRRVRVTFDLQDEFALHQPLSLWAIEAIGQLDAALVPERNSDPAEDGAIDEATGETARSTRRRARTRDRRGDGRGRRDRRGDGRRRNGAHERGWPHR